MAPTGPLPAWRNVLLRMLSLPILLVLALAPVAQGQEDTTWNSARVLALIERARDARQELVVDSAMHAYQADARGFVYFFIDRPDDPERTLVKADQIALEVYWRAPNDTKQRIVGLRDEKVLPTNIRYHLDHLTVVQDEFGDLIRLGDGDEVAAVLHPAAPGSQRVYDFRLADSLTLSFAGGRDPVRVFEVDVRPRDLDLPGFVGSLFLDRATAAIVRMTFTFTPSSYVDPYLDYIRISLDNGLWLDRFWLPYRQEVELRRELPQLDFLAGSIIRGRFEIGNYRFNEPLPADVFFTPGVGAVPEDERRAFPFERPLFADLESEGLAPSSALEDVERRVRSMVADRTLSGLHRTRLHVASFSDAVRYNRAEGLFLGMGAAFRPRATLAVRTHGGWAFGREAFAGRIEMTGGHRRPRTGLALYLDRLRDLGPLPGASGIVNSLATVAGEDYLDPFFTRGAEAFHRLGEPRGGRGLDLRLRWERHDSATMGVRSATSYRPLRGVDEGWVRSLELGLDLPDLPTGARLRTDTRLAHAGSSTYLTGQAHLAWSRQEAFQRLRFALDARIGAVGDGAPRQELYLFGGRGTLPGHDYRRQVGNRYWLVRGETGHAVRAPWVDVHAFLAVGRAWMADDRGVPPGWPGRGDIATRASLGAGVDLLWDVLRVDVAHGLGEGGDWALVFEISPRFHPWL
jgi:hypothetical protein